MFNFCKIEITEKKRDTFFIEPKFKISVRNSDLMIRGNDFYAVWDEESKLWVKDETFVAEMIDKAVWEKYNSINKKEGCRYIPMLMDDADSGIIDKWHKYCKAQLRDNYKELDKNVIFQNQETKRSDYATKKLPYDLVDGATPAYDELIGTLYDKEERQKLEWALGSIISGESKEIQKFIVLYGEPGSGKGTFLNLVMQMFDGYWETFNAKAIGAGKDFALASFRSNPLISIQTDGTLSKIEDNTLLNSIVSHEFLEVNEKFKSQYTMKCNSFLFLGSNDPVKITNAKSGILRRLIDVYPSGKKIPKRKYDELVKAMNFEFGSIANHVLTIFKELGPDYYNAYVPLKMFGATNDFYDFMEYYYDDFEAKEFVVFSDAWELYQKYCELAKVPFPLSMRLMRMEFANYFKEHKDSYYPERGVHYRNVFFGFRKDKFFKAELDSDIIPKDTWLNFTSHQSLFDVACGNCLAQYANEEGKPTQKWIDVKTRLIDLNTTKTHFVKINSLQDNHIVIDFDLKDSAGNKSLAKNIEAASQWPPTYAEISKSGSGVHLHYIYTGNVNMLSNIFDDNIEIKVFTGGSSLRRRLTKCNELQIATISSGLPLRKKEKKQMLDPITFKNELDIIERIQACLEKKPHPDTSSNIDYIKKILDDAYNSGMSYDVGSLYQAVSDFARGSTNQKARCTKVVSQMHFRSKDKEEFVQKDIPFAEDAPIVFFDVEVFPNLFLINWKFLTDTRCKRMINPTPLEVAELFRYRLIGFNNLRYDNMMLLARARGATNATLYHISKHIIHGNTQVVDIELSRSSKGISYADLYDIATKKQSLKKWEIELHIHHKELGYNWDEPIPEDKWVEVAEYCDNDVYATEAVYNAIQGDFEARKILAVISGLTVNTPDNQHSAKIIFGDDKNHKDEFVYTDLSKEFPGYKFEKGVSTYLGEVVGEGGAVRSKPGMYDDVWVFDIISMHPHSAKALNIFGEKYTKKFYSLVELRVAIKHGDIEMAKTMFDGKLLPYLNDKKYLKAIAAALKIVINSVYGLTSAHFDNPFRDSRNVDNIVAKRGALFILKLRHELEERGINVIHVKTDSIKVPSPSEETKQFIFDFAKKYGYQFEIEHIFDRLCLVNDAVYIGKYKEPEHDDNGNEIWWDATGAEFQKPFVYKTLFSKEPIEFYDLCETKAVKTALYLDFNGEQEQEVIVRNKPKIKMVMGDDPEKRVFIGRVGLFCPVKNGGGRLVRSQTKADGTIKYDSVADTSGYAWLEAEDVGEANIDKIDKSYYIAKADAARKHIEEFGDFEAFVS